MDIGQARALLKVDQNCTQQQLQRAWREIVLTCHPDRHAHLDEAAQSKAEALTKRVNLAYATLSAAILKKGVGTVRAPTQGQAPDLESLVRRAMRSVEQAVESVDAWSRQLKRARTGLLDGRRLLDDSDGSSAEFKRLDESVTRLINDRQNRVGLCFEKYSLRQLRKELATLKTLPSTSEESELLVARYLPSDPQVLVLILTEIQEIHAQTVAQMAPLAHRFELLSKELRSLTARLKTQHRTLRSSMSPFIESARRGRLRVDAAQVALAEASTILRQQMKRTKGEQTVLKSWWTQLLNAERSFTALQARQLEADAAELVYDRIIRRQQDLRSEGSNNAALSARLCSALENRFTKFWLAEQTYPQTALEELNHRVMHAIQQTQKK